jgi:hypothetical protein
MHNHGQPDQETPSGVKLAAAFLAWGDNDPATFNAAVAAGSPTSLWPCPVIRRNREKGVDSD